jgi:hypothetical protein
MPLSFLFGPNLNTTFALTTSSFFNFHIDKLQCGNEMNESESAIVSTTTSLADSYQAGREETTSTSN